MSQWALFCSVGRWDTPGLAEQQEPWPYRLGAAMTMVESEVSSASAHAPGGIHPYNWDNLTPASRGLVLRKRE